MAVITQGKIYPNWSLLIKNKIGQNVAVSPARNMQIIINWRTYGWEIQLILGSDTGLVFETRNVPDYFIERLKYKTISWNERNFSPKTQQAREILGHILATSPSGSVPDLHLILQGIRKSGTTKVWSLNWSCIWFSLFQNFDKLNIRTNHYTPIPAGCSPLKRPIEEYIK
jgi:hypothetical protein